MAVTMPLPISSTAMVATTAKPRRIDHDAMSPAMPVRDRASSTASRAAWRRLGLLGEVELAEHGAGVEA